MKKLFLILLVFSAFLFADDTTLQAHQDFVNKYEFTTFCTQENVNNNFFRGLLNGFVVFLKSLSVSNILFGILAFLAYLIVSGFFMTIGFGAFWWVIPASDLYYNNPLAVIGYFIDWWVTGVKLFLAMFGFYVVDFGSLVLNILGGIAIIIIIIAVIGLILSRNDDKNNKVHEELLRDIFGLFYKLALLDGKFSQEEKKYLKQYLYQFTQNLDLDKEIATTLDKLEENFEDKDIGEYAKNLKIMLEIDIPDKKQLKAIYQHLLNDLINFATIDGMDQAKKDALYKVAFHFDLKDMLDSIFNQNQNNQTNTANLDKDPYEILGVSPDDSFNEIKKKYKKLVQKYHPDKLSSKDLDEEFLKFAEDRMKEINEAYETIKKQHNQ